MHCIVNLHLLLFLQKNQNERNLSSLISRQLCEEPQLKQKLWQPRWRRRKRIDKVDQEPWRQTSSRLQRLRIPHHLWSCLWSHEFPGFLIFVQILIFKELCKNGCVIERWHRSSPIKKSMNFKLYLFYFWTCIIWLIAYRAVCFKTQFNPIWGRVENIRYVAGDECSTPPLLNTENHCDPTPASNRVKEIGPSIIWHCNLIFSVDSVDLLCKLFYATEMLKVRKQRTLFSRHNYVPSVMAIVVLYCS